MFLYSVAVNDDFRTKFENFLTNLNIVNSNKVVYILEKKEVVAIPKERIIDAV